MSDVPNFLAKYATSHQGMSISFKTETITINPLTAEVLVLIAGVLVKLVFGILSRVARYRNIDVSLLDI